MKIWKKCVLFYLGGMAYMLLELIWRGWSHGSMFLLGGLCFALLGRILRLRLPLWVKVLLGAATVTVLELLTGLAINGDHAIWDYSQLPFQFRGQISLVFSLLWMPVSLAGMWLYDQADSRL